MKEPHSIRNHSDLTARKLSRALEAPFEMANLRPKSTGLPMTIWVSERGRAKHGPRIKVSLKSGDRIDIGDTVTVTIEDKPRVIGGSLKPPHLDAVVAYIALNRVALLAYWNGEIDTADLLQNLNSLP